MKKTKLEKGITLIALIITIVVLLILSVVTIGAIQESKIIAHAKNAATGYNDEKSKEESAIAGYESLIDSKLPGGNGGSEIGKATVGKIADKNSTINGEAYSSTNPIIPAGFAPINITTTGQESSWNAEGGPEVDKGLVIRDESGNEFVWVPLTSDIDENGYNKSIEKNNYEKYNYIEPDVVTSSATEDSASGTKYDAVLSNLKRAGCIVDLNEDGRVNAYDFKIQLTNEYKSMAESINKYDGFYVGRYEVSFNEARKAQSKGSTEEISVYSAINSTKSSNDNNATDWYGLYALCKTYNTSSARGSMMWGIQYDEMMIWMGDAVNITIEDKKNKKRTCGTAPDDVIKNVYDLYGNSYEWTLESNNRGTNYYMYRVCRGGNYDWTYSPNWRSTTSEPTYDFGSSGSRLALCVM